MRIIDVHTHGMGNQDTRGATPEEVLKIAELHGSLGVDAILPTIYSGEIEQMRLDVIAVKKAMEMQTQPGPRFKGQGSRMENAATEVGPLEDSGIKNNFNQKNHQFSIGPEAPARILGVHLEGPFLNPSFAGALDKGSFLPVAYSKVDQLLDGIADIVRIITIAPELYGAPELIRKISNKGIIVNMGHSDATYNEAEEGFNAGAKGITHIFNAMRFVHHREPGIAGFGLSNPHVYIEIIADRFHLHQKTIELIFLAKPSDRIIIVSDSVKGTRINGATKNVNSPTGALLGGSMSITESAGYLTSLGISDDVVQGCISENPEEYLRDKL
ncbi:MAG TPA: hypothetical protein VHO84_13235 [Syntrophorhabdaceae bacterium]|nr:hypothetical protein [Syntrophorhabdaceae bacterium]